MYSEAADFHSWFPDPDGLPRPDWKTIAEFIRAHASAGHLESAWSEIAHTWLEKTADRLGGSYAVAESNHFFLLSELAGRSCEQLLAFCERSRARILHTLGDILPPETFGKHAVLRFTTQEEYYPYIAYFDPDGEWAGFSGRFIRGSGYMHIAYAHDDRPNVDWQIVAHELTHNLLSSFPLPAWLNEGLAMLFEEDLAGGGYPPLDRELADLHRKYWNPESIQDFWNGRSFAIAEAQKLSYSLARILLDFIVTDIRPAPADFREFVLHADRKDAGEAATRNYLGLELSDLVAAFLGPGEWGPRLGH